MDSEQETERRLAENCGDRRGRTWSERYGGLLRYRRFTDYDGGGRPSIPFRFELAPGQTELPPEVYDILQELKYLRPTSGHGKRPMFTGLEFTRDSRHGRVWRLPSSPTGRTVADLLDARLGELAARLEASEGKGR